DRRQIDWCLAGVSALVLLEQMLGQNEPTRPYEGVCPERVRIGKCELDRVVIDLLDRQILVRSQCPGGRSRIRSIFRREDAVVGCERRTIMPSDVPLQLPRNGLSICR